MNRRTFLRAGAAGVLLPVIPAIAPEPEPIRRYWPLHRRLLCPDAQPRLIPGMTYTFAFDPASACVVVMDGDRLVMTSAPPSRDGHVLTWSFPL